MITLSQVVGMSAIANYIANYIDQDHSHSDDQNTLSTVTYLLPVVQIQILQYSLTVWNTEPLKAKYELAGLPGSVVTYVAEIKAV